MDSKKHCVFVQVNKMALHLFENDVVEVGQGRLIQGLGATERNHAVLREWEFFGGF